MLYHKIQTVFHRDPATKYRTLIDGVFSLPEFEALQDDQWEGTEKIDGTNIRIEWDGKNLNFGGRTHKTECPPHVNKALSDMCNRMEYRATFGADNVTLFGEAYGGKVQRQKGGLTYSPVTKFILFDIFIEGDGWVDRGMVENMARAMGADCVPIVFKGTLREAIDFVKSAPDSTIGTVKMEGLVLRPAVEQTAANGDRVITKIKVNDFRL